MTATPESFAALQCPECQTVYEEADLAPIYECSRCGGTSAERRCEEDNIFMARIGIGCEDCGVECEEIEAVEDHDGTLILAEDWDPEASHADRAVAAAEKRDRERREQAQQKKEAREAAAEQVSVSALSEGEWIMSLSTDAARPERAVKVAAILPWGGPTVGLVVYEFGMPEVFPVSPDRQVTRVPEEPTVGSYGESFGKVTFIPMCGSMLMSSAPRQEEYLVEVSHLPRNDAPWGEVPALTLQRRSGSLLTVLGVFVSRGQAERALRVWEQAGQALAEARGRAQVADRRQVRVEEEKFTMFGDRLGRPVTVTLANSAWDDDDELYLNVDVSGSNATVADAGAWLGAVEALREQLEHLDRL